MIGIDYSLVAAVVIFLSVVVSLNYILLRPLNRVLEERASRTTGAVEKANIDIRRSTELFDQYQAALKAARMAGYRRMDTARAEALSKRAEALASARTQAEKMIEESRIAIRAQAEESKSRLGRDVDEIAQAIAASILGRPA